MPQKTKVNAVTPLGSTPVSISFFARLLPHIAKATMIQLDRIAAGKANGVIPSK
jgi:hypothetical protein